MSTTKRWVPAKFWDDHADRCPVDEGSEGIATVIRSAGSRVLIEGTAGQLDALRSDAAYYCDPAAFDEVDLPPGLRRSAAATIRALDKNLRNPPAGIPSAGITWSQK